MKRRFLGSSKKEPADSRTICKSTREESIDALQAASIDIVNQASNDTNPLVSDNIVHHGTVHHGTVHHGTVHRNTVHRGIVHLDTVHLPSIDNGQPASIDTVHPASIDNVRPNTVHCNAIHPGTVHPNIVHPDTVHPVKNNTTCGETEKIEMLILKGLPHQDPRKHIEELEDLVSRSEQNEESEYHMLCKIFPYSISGDAFSWFSQLQPGSLTSWDDIERAFLYEFLDDAEATREKEKNDRWDRFLASLDDEYMIPVQMLDAFMAKRDEQHVSGELSRVDEAGTEDAISTSTNGKTSTSTDITTSTSTDITTSTSTDITTSTSMDGSTQKRTDVSSCDLIPNVDIKITMEDFLELEDEAQSENLDHNLEKKLDDYQHTSEKDLETSKASIGRHQPDEIYRQPPHIIDLHPPDIDRHRQPLIDRHHTLNIDRCPWLDVPPCCIIEMEPIEERTYMSKASHLVVPKHQRPHIWTEEATEFHKRVKRIHDPVKIVVPCAVVEVESPIPPDRSMQLSPYIGGDVIPDVIVVAEVNDFDLSREWYDWVGKDPFQGLPHQDPIKHIEELEDLVSRSEQNEVSEYHMLCKIFPYSISGDAFSWFSQLQPRSLTSWDDIETDFLYKFLDDAEATREKEKNDRWDIKRDEQHVSGEVSRVEEAGTEDATSTSTDGKTSTSTDITTSTSTDITASTSTDITTSTSIDGSTQKSTDVSSCDLIPNVDIKITMEDFLELEDEAQPENLDHNLEKKLDDYQHTSEKDL
ncbi:hypothetical protein F2Q69_00036391 [Brassica cretica]|uniref:Retrotransposon gag domain-containing protein n=1 Tax=Brassica cretica TaxID=69181 RepID=A0A8S9SI94_BRACR|nr:hypothetical protein F2Q69_00036391 [Brassica cretica]